MKTINMTYDIQIDTTYVQTKDLLREAQYAADSSDYSRADYLLRELDRRLEDEECPNYELALLYLTIDRPIAALGFLLRHKRAGHEVAHSGVLKRCQTLIDAMDLDEEDIFPEDAYILGRELQLLGGCVTWAEFFLTKAMTGKRLAGLAALHLADLYSSDHNYAFATKFYEEAKAYGNPEYITH